MGKQRKIRAKNTRSLIKNLDDFKKVAAVTHNGVYDYSKSVYENSNTPLTIICPIHGVFNQRPNNHLAGAGCPVCSRDKQGKRLTKDEFIKKAREVHGTVYDYTLVKYLSNRIKVKIICLKHGIFEQRPGKHISGQGCPRCGNEPVWEHNRIDTEEFVRRARLRHGDRYDYSSTIYTDCNTKVSILCPKHGVFFQRSTLHLMGRGCPRCRDSRGEIKIKELLDQKGIKYFQQFTFKGCRDKRMLPFDFYIPSINTVIEFQGRQHYKPVSVWGDKEGLELIQLHDELKAKFCIDNRIFLRYIEYDDDIKERLDFILNTQYGTRRGKA